MLESMGWARCNFRFLHRWLTEHHAKNQPEVAVFDFDNTCIYHDIGEAVLRWQLEHKAFRFGAELPISTSIFEFLRTKSPMIPSASFPPGKSDVFLGDISMTSTFAKSR